MDNVKTIFEFQLSAEGGWTMYIRNNEVTAQFPITEQDMLVLSELVPAVLKGFKNRFDK